MRRPRAGFPISLRLVATALAAALACPPSALALRPQPDRVGLEEALAPSRAAAGLEETGPRNPAWHATHRTLQQRLRRLVPPDRELAVAELAEPLHASTTTLYDHDIRQLVEEDNARRHAARPPEPTIRLQPRRDDTIGPLTPAQQQLVEEHHDLVPETIGLLRKRGWEILPRSLQEDALYDAGMSALLGAARRFDPAHPSRASFRGYAFNRVEGAMRDYLRSEVLQSRRSDKRVMVPLDPLAGLGPESEDQRERPELASTEDWEAFFDQEDRKSLRTAIEATTVSLTARQRQVLDGVFEGQRNREIAHALGITETRVSQLLHKTLYRLVHDPPVWQVVRAYGREQRASFAWDAPMHTPASLRREAQMLAALDGAQGAWVSQSVLLGPWRGTAHRLAREELLFSAEQGFLTVRGAHYAETRECQLTPKGRAWLAELRAFLGPAADPSMVLGTGLEETGREPDAAAEPQDGLRWFENLIERAAEKAGTVQVSRRRFLKVAAATAKAVGAATLLPQFDEALPKTPTVAVPATVVTDAWVGYLTPERLQQLQALGALRTLEWTRTPVARSLFLGEDVDLPAYGARHGFEFLQRAQQMAQDGSGTPLTPEPVELQQLLAFFRDRANRARFVQHPAVLASLDDAHRTAYFAGGLFDQMQRWVEGVAYLSPPGVLVAQLAADPETTHLAWRVQRVLDGDAEFLTRDPWFQAEGAYWQHLDVLESALNRDLARAAVAPEANPDGVRLAKAAVDEWKQRYRAQQQEMDLFGRRLTGPFAAAPGDGRPTREAVANEIAEALTAELARYAVFTAALDRLGPAADPQVTARVFGRLLLAWTDPTIPRQEDVARRLAALIMALPPEEQARRYAQVYFGLHDFMNTLSVTIEHLQSLNESLPDALKSTPWLVSGRQALTVAFRGGWRSLRQAVADHDSLGVLTHGALLDSQSFGALRQIAGAWSATSSGSWSEQSSASDQTREDLDCLRWAIPWATALAEIVLGDLAGIPHPQGPLDLGRLARDAAKRSQSMARLQRGTPILRTDTAPPVIVTVPPEPLWVVANPVDLKRAVDNLVADAAEALKRVGRAAEGHIEILVASEDPWVTLTVRDNGPGLPDEVLMRINQQELVEQVPSAKPSETPGIHGVGLVSVKRRVVEDWSGQLEARNRPEGGAEILLRLPAIEPPPTAAASPEPAAGLEEAEASERVDVTTVGAQRRAEGLSSSMQQFVSQFHELPSEVFNPHNQWTALFLETMERLAPLFRDREVVDTGTGSLVLSRAALEVLGARRAVATELPGYPFNAIRRVAPWPDGVADRLELLTGSLLEPVRGRAFDVAIFNPPSQEVAEAYLREVGPALRSPSGFALLMWLQVSKPRFQAIARTQGLVLEPILQDGRYEPPGMGWQVYAITRTPERMAEIQETIAAGLEHWRPTTWNRLYDLYDATIRKALKARAGSDFDEYDLRHKQPLSRLIDHCTYAPRLTPQSIRDSWKVVAAALPAGFRRLRATVSAFQRRAVPLHSLYGTLLYDRARQEAIVIVGQGAIGKSTLAMQLVNDPNQQGRWEFLADDALVGFVSGNRLIVGGDPRSPGAFSALTTYDGHEGPSGRKTFAPVFAIVRFVYDNEASIPLAEQLLGAERQSARRAHFSTDFLERMTALPEILLQRPALPTPADWMETVALPTVLRALAGLEAPPHALDPWLRQQRAVETLGVEA